ncbi:hypothetical protein ACIPSE_46445 [Streptomyces sp. NPDC090106]|uniref:hypothetical protein n=1 Tax=Streptomyces sp. NPDC090106 TaxID=3365946 RepID=UPI0038136F1E
MIGKIGLTEAVAALQDELIEEFGDSLLVGLDVPVGAGEALAIGPAVVGVGGDHGVVRRTSELAGCESGVEDAGHALSVVDLQKGVTEQVAGMTVVVHDSAGELATGCMDAVAVGVCGGAADVLACAESAFVLGDAFHAEEPVLERVAVQESGFV